MTLRVPPLRERPEDLPELVADMLHTAHADHRLPEEVLRLFTAYSWPGNVRELKNILERALLLSQGGPLRADHFAGLSSRRPPPHTSLPGTIQEAELTHVATVWSQTGGDPVLAAKRLGISRATLYRKLKQYGMIRSRAFKPRTEVRAQRLSG